MIIDLDNHPDFFVPLAEYQPRNEYFDHVAEMLPTMWRLKQDHYWTYCFSPQAVQQVQGWKIHVSALPESAMRILSKVVPVCLAHGVEFKFASDRRILNDMTGKHSARQSGGKFVVLYPASAESFKAILEELYPLLQDEQGPHVLSDRQYRDSKVLFYRYGGFHSLSQRDVHGATTHSIVNPEFHLVEDQRKPYFSLPSFVSDDFVRPRAAPRSADVPGGERKSPPLLNGRFRVDAVIKHANAGSMYQATEVELQRRVALKEARPNVALDAQGGDAISRLTKEYRLLNTLAGSGIGPAAYALFSHWRHTFMALEFIEGTTLHEYRTQFHAMLDAGADTLAVTRRVSEVIRIALDLLGKLSALHQRNIVFGDLSLRNIMIDPATLAIRLVDFEGAFELGVDRPVNLLTRGFIRRERAGKQIPDFGDDCYALGCVLLALVAPNSVMQALQPDYVPRLFDELEADIALPRAYGECVVMLMAGEADCLPACIDRLESIAHLSVRPLPLEAHGQTHETARYANTVREVFRYIGDVMELERGQRAFPVGPNFADPLALDFGALGIAYAWQRCAGALPPKLRQWLAYRFQPEGKLPGLLNGLSGMAWVLAELGMSSQATAAIDAAGTHRLLYQHMTLGYGAAGYGMSRLALWRLSGDARHLQEARRTAEAVCASAQPHAVGCYWSDGDGGADGVRLGYHDGASGIALFLLYMYCATGEPRYLATGEQGLDFDLAHSRRVNGMLGFPARANSRADLASPYLSKGTAGVATVALRYFVLTGKERYRQLLEDVKPALACKYQASPDLHQGLAGIGHYLLDMHDFLGDTSYLDLAFRLARGISLFEAVRDAGSSFPLLKATKLGCDYACGSAGVALFLDRLVRGGGNANFMVDELLHERLAERRRGAEPLTSG